MPTLDDEVNILIALASSSWDWNKYNKFLGNGSTSNYE